MIRPAYLKKGDTIGIVAPAGALSEKEIADAVKIMRSWGLEIKYGMHVFKSRHSFAGTDKQRAEDFQEMMDDRSIKAIVCARGGYGSIRMIGKLNFTRFIEKPKWIIGYSDITIFHSALQQCLGIESIHGAMPRLVPPKKPDLASFESLRAMLFGEISEYRVPSHNHNREGRGKGILTGGNLSVLYSIAGSEYEPDTYGKILFIEDLNEYLYHVDRMMMNLKIRGKLAGLKGLIVGDMLDMKGNSSGFNKPAYRVILDAVKEYDYPVLFGFPSGHGERNLALPMGRTVEVVVGEKESRISFSNE